MFSFEFQMRRAACMALVDFNEEQENTFYYTLGGDDSVVKSLM